MVVEKLEKSRMKATFDVKADEFEEALDTAFTICNEKVTIKGFRKGHAPRPVYEKNYGVESLYDEALNVVLNAKVKELYADETLREQICSQFVPDVVGKDFERGKDFQVTLSFDVYPEVSLGQYKGIEIAKANLEVSEDEITESINGLLKSQIQVIVKENQVIENGDIAIFDFCGSVDGVEFEGGKAENYELKIGSGQFIPGFEEQMVGMKADETKTVKVTFPEKYQATDLAGKNADFVVTVHEVKEEKAPELTDELVASLEIENVKTVEELKVSKKAELEANKAQQERDRQTDEIINKILDNAVVDMPDSLIEERVNQIKQQYESQAQMYNIPFATFLQLMGSDEAKFNEQALEQGKRQALFNVVISKLIEVEKLAPSKEEIDAKAEEEAAKTKAKKEELLRDRIGAFYSELAYKKVVEFLLANAKLV